MGVDGEIDNDFAIDWFCQFAEKKVVTLRQSAVPRRNETDFLAIDRRMPDICVAEKFYVCVIRMWHFGDCMDGHACGGRVNFCSAVFKESLFSRTECG